MREKQKIARSASAENSFPRHWPNDREWKALSVYCRPPTATSGDLHAPSTCSWPSQIPSSKRLSAQQAHTHSLFSFRYLAAIHGTTNATGVPANPRGTPLETGHLLGIKEQSHSPPPLELLAERLVVVLCALLKICPGRLNRRYLFLSSNCLIPYIFLG